MAYRIHVQVYGEGGKRLRIARLERELVGVLTPRTASHVGYVGTHQGAPGIWIERDDKSSLRTAVSALARFGANTGYRFRFNATNAPSFTAVADLVPVQRG